MPLAHIPALTLADFTRDEHLDRLRDSGTAEEVLGVLRAETLPLI